MDPSAVTKVFFVPLGEYEPPALLVVHSYPYSSGTAAEAHLLLAAPPDPAAKPTAEIVAMNAPGKQAELFQCALMKIEPELRRLRNAVPVERKAQQLMREAPPDEVNARRALGHYPQLDSLPGFSRGSMELRTALAPYSARYHFVPLTF